MEQEIAIVGLDLAKNVFQVHAIGADGAVLVRRKLRRAEVIGLLHRPSKLRGRHGSVRIGAPLGSRADRTRPRSPAHAAGLR